MQGPRKGRVSENRGVPVEGTEMCGRESQAPGSARTGAESRLAPPLWLQQSTVARRRGRGQDTARKGQGWPRAGHLCLSFPTHRDAECFMERSVTCFMFRTSSRSPAISHFPRARHSSWAHPCAPAPGSRLDGPDGPLCPLQSSRALLNRSCRASLAATLGPGGTVRQSRTRVASPGPVSPA